MEIPRQLGITKGLDRKKTFNCNVENIEFEREKAILNFLLMFMLPYCYTRLGQMPQ